ncbi:hypothetical protein CesoFtcFv8_017420 [Champsocephalus esox]|uniref:Uncharacterized protein n=1 Tax=Champsocephalus esox TaxID=159716 RepID=A0AAN8BKN4_9TELE|nr:hypothetical protein CesoFtcFv8_017420 [Champsocephalus esox]
MMVAGGRKGEKGSLRPAWRGQVKWERSIAYSTGREQISKKIEAHQSFQWGGGFVEQQPNAQEISNLVSELSAEGFVTEWSK